MKKVILALAIVSVTFAACNDGKTTETTTNTDSAVIANPTPAPDSVIVVTDSTVKTTVTTDTIKK